MRQPTDNTIQLVVANLPNLEELRIAGLTTLYSINDLVTEVGARCIAEGLPHLTNLNLGKVSTLK